MNPAAIASIQHDSCRYLSFYNMQHQEMLDSMGRPLPFEPVEVTESTPWRCERCGAIRRFTPVIEGQWFDTGPSVLFSPDTTASGIICSNVTMLSIYRHHRRGWGRRIFDEVVCGPLQEPWADDDVLIKRRVGTCGGERWRWSLEAEATRQVLFLAMLPFWCKLEQGEDHLGTMGDEPMFPAEWMDGKLDVVVNAARIDRLEQAMTEVVARLESAGQSLLGGAWS